MVRELVYTKHTDTLAYVEYAGLSTDSKPTSGIVTGSTFFEVDTGDVYAFAEGDAPAWYKIGAGPTAEG